MGHWTPRLRGLALVVHVEQGAAMSTTSTAPKGMGGSTSLAPKRGRVAGSNALARSGSAVRSGRAA